MSTYYNQEFVSAEPLIAEVRESMRSYFNTGAVDDMMFPIWIGQALAKFRKAAYRITETLLEICNSEVCLPDNFKGVREVWACTVTHSNPIDYPSAQYYQKDCRIDPESPDSCNPCQGDECSTTYLMTHKVTHTYFLSFRKSMLLRPGNMNARTHCSSDCRNLHANTPFTFDIHNGKMITNFESGHIYLIYYEEPNEEEMMVPDNFWIQDYIRKYLIYKTFEQLSNQVTDETFNQIMQKLDRASQQCSEAFILADTESKKWTNDYALRRIQRDKIDFFRKYNIR